MNALKYIYERIEQKQRDYVSYTFPIKEHIALATFFDLAQEFDSVGDLYNICVAVPKAFFKINARLYFIGSKHKSLVLVAANEIDEKDMYTPPPDDVKPHTSPYKTERNTLVLTIRGNKLLIDQLPFDIKDDVIGLLEVYPADGIGGHEELFFEKYANRVGFNIHNRFLVEKNIEHLKFIKTLVADIEHNIIVPNMIYKLYLRNLRNKILKNEEIEKFLHNSLPGGQMDGDAVKRLHEEVMETNHGLKDEFTNIEKHYKNMSLFLETLLRRSHFDQGRLILRTKPCQMKKDVVQPQIDRFIERFRQMGIEIDDRFGGIPEEEVISVVDIGLMAQVYANLFSNTLKYTEEVTIEETGNKKRYIAYGRELIIDFFGPGKDGVKYNVFSTGSQIKSEEQGKIFDEGFQGSNTQGRPGTGHGLAFIKNIVELHGGVVGYEYTHYGNNFYFVLPSESE